jgi:hypothetical protein
VALVGILILIMGSTFADGCEWAAPRSERVVDVPTVHCHCILSLEDDSRVTSLFAASFRDPFLFAASLLMVAEGSLIVVALLASTMWALMDLLSRFLAQLVVMGKLFPHLKRSVSADNKMVIDSCHPTLCKWATKGVIRAEVLESRPFIFAAATNLISRFMG